MERRSGCAFLVSLWGQRLAVSTFCQRRTSFRPGSLAPLVELAQWRQGWREAPPPRPPVRVGGVVRTGSAHTKRALWATGTTQQNGCCAASRLRGSIPASPHCLSRLAVPSRAETVSVLRRLDRAREAGGKGRKALAQREVGRLRTHWGGGVCLERGLDGKEEGRGRRGQERGGQGREACAAQDWALLCREVGARRFEG